MASLVDTGLLDQYRRSRQGTTRGVNNLIGGASSVLSDIGTAIAGRFGASKEAGRDLAAQFGALETERAAVQSELDSLDSTATNYAQSDGGVLSEVAKPFGPYETAERDTHRENARRRLSQIDAAKDQLSQIVEPSFRDYKSKLPQIGERQDFDPNYRDIQRGLQVEDADRKASILAQKESTRVAERAEDKATQKSQFDRRLAEQKRERLLRADEREEAKAAKRAILPPKLATIVENSDVMLDTLEATAGTINDNIDFLSSATKRAREVIGEQRKGTATGDAWAGWLKLTSGMSQDEIEKAKPLLDAIETIAGPKRSKMFGAVLTPTEELKAEANLPAPGDNEAELQRKFRTLYSLARIARDRALKQADTAGYNTSAHDREYNEISFSSTDTSPTKPKGILGFKEALEAGGVEL
ncbi:hypothetical protein [uncultured Paraglaciecola sp.]|uniref:hypothetical protein n=1 Tax=uncultured Paraglaciecola sp. TaxID=1765024 RepID=UPI0026293755|nr:hypothetical protein [uncultured Paraglaciecola sp.]